MLRALGRPLLTHTRISTRTLSTTPRRLSDHGPPSLFGPGSPPGVVPSDEAQATGLDRLQLLGKMEGVDVFNMKPLDMVREGTVKEPIVIPSLAKERVVGCTGFPAESHDVIWLTMHPEKKGRCPECGNVYELDFQGVDHDGHH